jgi:adenine/guanine/hypoxanthine permease
MPQQRNSVHTMLDHFFRITARKSSVRTEILSGVSTFLSLSYIFVIHPVILGAVGFNLRSVLIATVIVSALSTITSGLWSGLPFVFAPGLEMSVYIAFVAIPVKHLSINQVLGVGILTGAFLCITCTKRIKQVVIERVPHRFPNAVAVAMSAFLLTYAGSLMGVLDYTRGNVEFTGHIYDKVALMGLGAILAITLFEVLGWRPSVLLSVLIVSIVSRAGQAAQPQVAHSLFQQVRPDFWTWMSTPKAWLVAFTLFLLSCYGSLFKLINLAQGTTIADQHGAIPGVRKILMLDGMTAIASGFLGTTSATTFIESGSGIVAGGRTGLTAIVAGILMAAGVFLVPLVTYIPVTAAVGALVYVGFLIIPKGDALRAFNQTESWIVGVMVVVVIAIQSLGIALAIGLIGFSASHWWQTRTEQRVSVAS